MSKHQKPLRAALIGLSSSGAGSWAANAHLPNLVTPAGRSRYNITALLNSSEEAAKSAIKKYNLASTTKAYGTPEALAQDKDIDVVICNTRVDQHYSTILPSIKAGQDVYVEWPIAHDIAHIEEVVEAARASGSRVAVGIHRRWLPPVLKVKELIRDGGLGKVLSAHAIAYGGREDRQTMTPKIKYFADRKIGGNVITISSAHGKL
jgi:predicted dehydrogenase